MLSYELLRTLLRRSGDASRGRPWVRRTILISLTRRHRNPRSPSLPADESDNHPRPANLQFAAFALSEPVDQLDGFNVIDDCVLSVRHGQFHFGQTRETLSHTGIEVLAVSGETA